MKILKKRKSKIIRILEIGPGTGKLMRDIVKCFKDFNILNNIDINFVEVSDFLSTIQQDNINKLFLNNNIILKYELIKDNKGNKEYELLYNKEYDISIKWFNTVESFLVNNFKLDKNKLELADTQGLGRNKLELLGTQSSDENNLGLSENENLDKNINLDLLEPMFILCHEYFDALPSDIFVYKDYKWHEKKVEYNRITNRFQYILDNSNKEKIDKILNPLSRFDNERIPDNFQIEISSKSMLISSLLFELINKTNSIGLIIDYGEDYYLSDSLRGIYNHKFVPNDYVLDFPGLIDLSFYVDFSLLKNIAEQNSLKSSLLPQGLFLEEMGIVYRMENLIKNNFSKDKEKLFVKQYERLVDPKQMGEIYKFLYVGNSEIFPFN